MVVGRFPRFACRPFKSTMSMKVLNIYTTHREHCFKYKDQPANAVQGNKSCVF
jgi:hypothetical protein